MMKTTSLTIAGLAAITAMGASTLASAQAKKPAAAPAAPRPAAAAPAPAAAQPPVFTGTAPGVCILSREGLVGASTVGKYVQTRLQQLTSQANAEVTGDQTSLQNDAKALDANKALVGTARQTQEAALQQRLQTLQAKAQQREAEIQATQQKAVQRVLSEASPLVNDQIKAKGCGVLLDGDAILGANPSLNLTPSVVAALNAKITQFDFDREHLDAQQAAQQR